MGNHHLSYFDLCKKRIEDKLDWSNSSQEWKQRDYLNLIALLENKTGISLSLSTIKRLWHKNYQGTPHPSTLDALAKFLDHEDWLSFQKFEKSNITDTIATTPPHQKTAPQHQTLILLSSVLLLVLAALFWVFSLKTEKDQNGTSVADHEIIFTAQTSKSKGVPNTVIFRFDLSNITADSFFIQQSWNPFNKERISKEDSVLTSIYYYPGVHTAKLIANDSIVKETTVRVYSKEWIAAIRYGEQDLVPTYLNLGVTKGSPNLSVTEQQLSAHNQDLNEEMFLSYSYVDTFSTKVSGDDFTLSLKLKGDSLLNLTCPRIGIMTIGEHETHTISLIDRGCTHQAFVKFGEVVKSGRNTDLSNFGITNYEWQAITISVQKKIGRVYLHDQLILEVPYLKSIGEIIGFNIYFAGTGQIELLRLEKGATGIVAYSTIVE